MSHTVKGVSIIADQEIEICGRKVNIHNVRAVVLSSRGTVTDAYLEPDEQIEAYRGWLSKETPQKGGD